MIHGRFLEEWNHRYQSGVTGRVTKIFFPDAITAYPLVRKINPWKELTQIFTGHGGFSEHLTRFHCKEDPLCICEPNTQEDVTHILIHCPVYTNKRHALEHNIDTRLSTNNIHTLLRDTEKREHLRKYFEEVARSVIARNKQ